VNHALKVSPVGRDCLDVARSQITAAGWATDAELDSMRVKASVEVELACGQALRDPLPDPGQEDWCALSTRSLCEGSEH
jgi:TPP-dependent pyruvate/acetoin dehydrogenase alpha subunit